MYTSELKLNSDSTFAFYDWGCTEKRFTQGRWKVTDGDILLSSYDTYKPKHDDLPIGTILLPRIKGKKPHLKKGEAEYSIVGMKDTLVVGPRGRDDTTWVYFDHLPLQLKKDSLCVKSKDLPGPVNFYRTF